MFNYYLVPRHFTTPKGNLKGIKQSLPSPPPPQPLATTNLLSVSMDLSIQDCYVFLDNWLHYHYIIPLFIPDNYPCSEVNFVWN